MGGRKRAQGRRGGGGIVYFYFNGKDEEEDLPSELENDLHSSENKWGEGREDGEDADKEKNIKTAWAFFTITCLDFVLDKIKPLGFLHLNMEGWDTYTLCGPGVALPGVDYISFVVCEVWDERDSKRRHIALRDANGFGPTCDNVLTAMAEHPNFERIDNIIDQDRNLCLCFRGEEDSGGGQMKMCVNYFMVSIPHRHTQEILRVGKQRQISLLYPQ